MGDIKWGSDGNIKSAIMYLKKRGIYNKLRPVAPDNIDEQIKLELILTQIKNNIALNNKKRLDNSNNPLYN